MTFFEKLLEHVNAQLAASDLAVDPANVIVRQYRIEDLSTGPQVVLTLGMVAYDLNDFEVRYPLANLTYHQSAALGTDTVIDLPGNHTLETLVAAINDRLPPVSHLDPSLLRMTTEFSPSGDGELIYVLEPAPDPLVPAYYGSIRLYAAGARSSEIALHAIMAKSPLLVNSNLDYFEVGPTGGLLLAGAYIGTASRLEDGPVDAWPCWEIEQPVVLYLNHAAVVPESSAPEILGLTLESPYDGFVSNARELLLKANRNAQLSLTFWRDKTSPFKVDSTNVTLVADQVEHLRLYGIPEDSWLEISSLDGGGLALQAGMRFLAGQSLYPEYDEYRPTAMTAAGEKFVRFRGLDLLESPHYLLLKPEMSMGAVVSFPQLGDDTVVQTLESDGEPLVVVQRVSHELHASISHRGRNVEMRANIPRWDSSFTYYFGWRDGTLTLIVDDVVQVQDFQTTDWVEDGVFYILGGSGYGQFDLYRHFVGHREDAHSRQIWNAEYWQ